MAVVYALAHEIHGTLPFLVLFQVGYLYLGVSSLAQQGLGDEVALETLVAPD